jgi:hypothetical protein
MYTFPPSEDPPSELNDPGMASVLDLETISPSGSASEEGRPRHSHTRERQRY